MLLAECPNRISATPLPALITCHTGAPTTTDRNHFLCHSHQQPGTRHSVFLVYFRLHLKASGYKRTDMHTQSDFDLHTTVSSDDMGASYIPASFDDFLVYARLRHRRPRKKTSCKLHSPIILRANTDMPAHKNAESAHRPYGRCLSMPNMATEQLRLAVA